MSPVSFLPHTLPHSAHNSLIITCTCTMSAPSSSPAYKHTLLLCSLSGLLVSIQTTYLSTYLLRLLQRSSPAIYFSVSPVSPQSSIVCLFRKCPFLRTVCTPADSQSPSPPATTVHSPILSCSIALADCYSPAFLK